MVTRVLFVCMGNICRSPMAEGAFRAAVGKAGVSEQFQIDSAGTIGYHAGSAPDPRAIAVAHKHGINIRSQRSRKVVAADFAAFDYILAMDNDNLADLLDQCPEGYQDRISLFLSHAEGLGFTEMPDPYYGHDSGFDDCFESATKAAAGLLATILASRREA